MDIAKLNSYFESSQITQSIFFHYSTRLGCERTLNTGITVQYNLILPMSHEKKDGLFRFLTE